MQQSEQTPGVSGWPAGLPPGGDWENALGKCPSAEPAALSPKSVRLADSSATAHAGTNPGAAIKILWPDNASWSKNIQYHQIKPSI
jgi:hypothetical protein